MTDVPEIFLLGFQVSHDLRIFLFCLLLCVFAATICGNVLIVTLVSSSKNLHTPMYFFISHLSISDILVTSGIAPIMLHTLMNNGMTIYFIDCLAQWYFFCSSETLECFLLTMMSYDRYVAICNPLRYNSVMTRTHCVMLATTCWFLGFFISIINTHAASNLTFCGPIIIDHFFCDLIPLLEISCSDISIVKVQNYFLSIPLLIVPTIIIIVCYVKIIVTILQIPSNISRQKAFSTCSAHLTVVSIFYSAIFSVYIVPTKGQSSISKILSLLYTVLTPLINPIIYSLRNKDIKRAVNKTFRKCT